MQTSVERATGIGAKLYYVVSGQTGLGSTPPMEKRYLFSGGQATKFAFQAAGHNVSNWDAAWALHNRVTYLVGILEKFNGITFLSFNGVQVFSGVGVNYAPQFVEKPSGGGVVPSDYDPYVFAPMRSQQIDLLEQSDNALKESAYGGLVLQTRFKPLINSIGLVLTVDGIELDFSEVELKWNAANESVCEIWSAA